MTALRAAVERGAGLEVRWASLRHRLAAAAARAISERLKAPNDARDLAVMLARERDALASDETRAAGAVLDTLTRCDALRRPERFATLLEAAACCDPQFDAAPWHTALAAAQGIDAGALAAACTEKREIPERIRDARIAAIAAARPG